MVRLVDLEVYKLAEQLSDKVWKEETKTWLRKLIRKKVVVNHDIIEYEVIINNLGPKLNAFISSTK